jgi:hypothetical protein
MKLAWVTHHLPRDIDSSNPAHLPGAFVGGAEMTDAALIAAAPQSVQVQLIEPDDWAQALDADDIVVTGTDLLTDEAMTTLAARKPAVFIHHKQTPNAARSALLSSARVLIVHTPAHREREARWTSLPKRVALVLSPMDPAQIPTEPKHDFALWAQRTHPLKGLRGAQMWAAQHDIDFVALSNVDRETVLTELAKARWFIHLPVGFESESRATIEAVLAGCECITNSNVGITSVDGWDDPPHLADLVTTAAQTWWKAVLT